MNNRSKDYSQEEQTLRGLLSDLCTLLQEFKQNQENSGPHLCQVENCARVETPLSDDLIDAVDVQELFRITKSTYYRWVRRGILTPIKMNKKDFYRKSDLKVLLHRRKYRERM